MRAKQLSCFISPHGYGHATRCIAVLETLSEIHPELSIQIITTVPRSLIAETLTDFSYHPVEVDIGMVQASALDADLSLTIDALDKFLPFDGALVEHLAKICRKSSFILSDIAPLGIAVAKTCGIESILIENFTWDWIYQPYAEKHPGLQKHITYLQEILKQVDHRIQTEPLCNTADHSLHCGPIYRKSKVCCTNIKKELGCNDKTLVLITMGGVNQPHPCLEKLLEAKEFFFIFSGQAENRRIENNIHFLPASDTYYHPDLICAADIVICKAGYSTVAECCQAGARVLAVAREDFSESAVLQKYLEARLNAIIIDPKQYLTSSWIPLLHDLMKEPCPEPEHENGANSAAQYISKLLTATNAGKR
jgi:hypothetical protein